jgi:hypothetical protein
MEKQRRRRPCDLDIKQFPLVSAHPGMYSVGEGL